MLIPLGPGKYQVCVAPDCGGDAVSEFYAVNAKGHLKCLGACAAHLKVVRGIAASIATGFPVVYAEEHAFEAAVDEDTKREKTERSTPPQRRNVVSRARNTDDGTPDVAKPSQVKHTTDARSGWSWIYDTGLWRTVSGDVVDISRMNRDELASAIKAIAATNFQRLKADLAIIKQVTTPSVMYTYPRTALGVGQKHARLKLHEMYKVWAARMADDKPA